MHKCPVCGDVENVWEELDEDFTSFECALCFITFRSTDRERVTEVPHFFVEREDWEDEKWYSLVPEGT